MTGLDWTGLGDTRNAKYEARAIQTDRGAQAPSETRLNPAGSPTSLASFGNASRNQLQQQIWPEATQQQPAVMTSQTDSASSKR